MITCDIYPILQKQSPAVVQKQIVPKTFAKFVGIHLHRSPFLVKLYAGGLRKPFSQKTSGWVLLNLALGFYRSNVLSNQ